MIRPATLLDIEALAHIEVACFGSQAWSEGQLRSEFSVGRQLVVATENDEVRGYACTQLDSEVAELFRIAVAGAARQQGLGTTLLESAIDTATTAGAERMLLEVSDDNSPAISMYERAGFCEIARRRGYYRGHDAVVMERQLADE